MSIGVKIRSLVPRRAEHRCEYCLLHESDMFIAFEIDHIVAQKHGGGNEIENLAYACPHCNQHKGTDLVTFIDNYDDISRIFNPRKDTWSEHFEIEQGEILAISKIGAASIKLLKFNDIDLLILRKILGEAGRYP